MVAQRPDPHCPTPLHLHLAALTQDSACALGQHYPPTPRSLPCGPVDPHDGCYLVWRTVPYWVSGHRCLLSVLTRPMLPPTHPHTRTPSTNPHTHTYLKGVAVQVPHECIKAEALVAHVHKHIIATIEGTEGQLADQGVLQANGQLLKHLTRGGDGGSR